MELKSFYGTLFNWCIFVNENGIKQEQIATCNMNFQNNDVIVAATYWEIKL